MPAQHILMQSNPINSNIYNLGYHIKQNNFEGFEKKKKSKDLIEKGKKIPFGLYILGCFLFGPYIF